MAKTNSLKNSYSTQMGMRIKWYRTSFLLATELWMRYSTSRRDNWHNHRAVALNNRKRYDANHTTIHIWYPYTCQTLLTHWSLVIYICQWTMVQAMACHLFGTMPLPKPMLTIIIFETDFNEILIKIKRFPFNKMLLAKCQHFLQVSMR